MMVCLGGVASFFSPWVDPLEDLRGLFATVIVFFYSRQCQSQAGFSSTRHHVDLVTPLKERCRMYVSRSIPNQMLQKLEV